MDFVVASPPKSPTLDLDIEAIRTISSSSSVEVMSDVSPSSTTNEVTQRMTELVQERIASLGLKPGKNGTVKHLGDLGNFMKVRH